VIHQRAARRSEVLSIDIDVSRFGFPVTARKVGLELPSARLRLTKRTEATGFVMDSALVVGSAAVLSL
jgi:hypothetical protein